jgi:hypothetical protein
MKPGSWEAPTLVCFFPSHLPSSSHSQERHLDEIRSHSRSLMRFTYRSSFPPLSPYNINSDAGWGCMLRSAQMIMAQAFQRHFLGRGLKFIGLYMLKRTD